MTGKRKTPGPEGANKRAKTEHNDPTNTRHNDLTDEVFRKKIIKMSEKCTESMAKFRSKDWTTYARNSGNYVYHNFGLGLELAVKCFGCRRLIPPVLITGDHIVPKSDIEKLKISIAYNTDGLDRSLYNDVLNMRLSLLRDDEIYLHILNIRKYNETLDHDLRNIQPLCWYCNSVKGNRDNVKLFPQNVLLPKRPHEAPF